MSTLYGCVLLLRSVNSFAFQVAVQACARDPQGFALLSRIDAVTEDVGTSGNPSYPDLSQLLGLYAVSFRSPNKKRRKRVGIIDIGKWPSPATAAVPIPSRSIPKITNPKMTRPVMTFSTHEWSIEHLLHRLAL